MNSVYIAFSIICRGVWNRFPSEPAGRPVLAGNRQFRSESGRSGVSNSGTARWTDFLASQACGSEGDGIQSDEMFALNWL